MNRRHHLALSARWLATAAVAPWALAACAGRETAPDFAFTLLGGRTQQFAQARQGKVMLVNFWATSCTTCVKEMPQMVETFNKFNSQGYEMLAVAMNYDNPEFVANFAQSRQLPFGVTHDRDGAIAKAFGDVRLTPTSFLVDKSGAVVKKYVGEPDFADFQRLIGELLKA
ncbi:TlpA family protein disulfide reductase [Ideonella sp. 4Y16]|uniref:TlpA family protein disulfide reductase n=1 Tax=Ideonella alba TaxID=2824118 RepID=A0A940YBW9_9BURK|nr:TlpA disulfide reductase family protein [Ideonella alba]MBQ0932743.1 TlpA family protein disulfide reductase [Ideonella alba]MBQ0946450.1 TlpA family protein disulfide reductase [Ideonella alba]